jgi:hypothetical protein
MHCKEPDSILSKPWTLELAFAAKAVNEMHNPCTYIRGMDSSTSQIAPALYLPLLRAGQGAPHRHLPREPDWADPECLLQQPAGRLQCRQECDDAPGCGPPPRK